MKLKVDDAPASADKAEAALKVNSGHQAHTGSR